MAPAGDRQYEGRASCAPGCTGSRPTVPERACGPEAAGADAPEGPSFRLLSRTGGASVVAGALPGRAARGLTRCRPGPEARTRQGGDRDGLR